MKRKKDLNLKKPLLIEGDISVDDRGEVEFVNKFDMRPIRRFYTVSNHKTGFVRAWHAHKQESKFVTVLQGAAIVAAVKIDNWKKPSPKAKVWRYTLSSEKPTVLFIPKGYANGFMNLTKKTKLMFFSPATLAESRGDDIRYDAHYWNPWEIAQR